jgi:hypothetical protein
MRSCSARRCPCRRGAPTHLRVGLATSESYLTAGYVGVGGARPRRSSQRIRVSTRLNTIMVVKGAMSLKPGRSIMRSPGRRPRASLHGSHGARFGHEVRARGETDAVWLLHTRTEQRSNRTSWQEPFGAGSLSPLPLSRLAHVSRYTSLADPSQVPNRPRPRPCDPWREALGNLLSHGHSRPIAAISSPSEMSRRCTARRR